MYKEVKKYEENALSSESEFLNKMNEKLSKYRMEERETVTLFFNKENRIVAFKTSDDCLAICASTKKYSDAEDKMVKSKNVVWNYFNPVFVLFTKENDNLAKDITLTARIVKSAGDLNLCAFKDSKALIGTFPYDEEYKIPNNVFYDSQKRKLNIKSIAAITRDKNKVTLKSDEDNLGFNFKYNVDDVLLTTNHTNYASLYLTDKEKILKK